MVLLLAECHTEPGFSYIISIFFLQSQVQFTKERRLSLWTEEGEEGSELERRH